MRVLFSGDVAWSIGRNVLAASIPILKRDYGPFDFIVLNCENAAHGKGMTPKIFDQFIALGIDAMTSGNHIWDKSAFFPVLDADTRVFRPANYSAMCPGRGHGIIERKGKRLGILNLQGQVFMPPIDNPFMCADACLEELQGVAVIVDFHAEATSEKLGLANYLDGRVAAVIGTHTHVQTADERILPKGTAYITDAGMTGSHGGMLGVSYESAMPKFLTGLPVKFEPCEENPAFNGVVIEIDEASNLASSITRVNLAADILI